MVETSAARAPSLPERARVGFAIMMRYGLVRLRFRKEINHHSRKAGGALNLCPVTAMTENVEL
jgi:hypothetical protein